MAKLFFIGDDLHRSAAEDEARTHEHGIAYLVCRFDAVLYLRDGTALRLRDIEVDEDLFKAVAVLGALDRLAVGAYDLNASFHKRLSKIYRRLSAERRDNTFGLFVIDYRHDVFGRERLEIELVRRGVVGRDGLGIVIDNDSLIPRALDRLHGMDGRIVKFHALTDADRTRAEHYDLLFVGQLRRVLARVRRIQIRDILAGVERIDHLEYRRDAVLLAEIIYLDLGHIPKRRDKFVGEAHCLRLL